MLIVSVQFFMQVSNVFIIRPCVHKALQYNGLGVYFFPTLMLDIFIVGSN